MANQCRNTHIQGATRAEAAPWNLAPLRPLAQPLLRNLLLHKALLSAGGAKVLGGLVGTHQQPHQQDAGADEGGEVEDRRPTAHNVLAGAEEASQWQNQQSS